MNMDEEIETTNVSNLIGSYDFAHVGRMFEKHVFDNTRLFALFLDSTQVALFRLGWLCFGFLLQLNYQFVIKK